MLSYKNIPRIMISSVGSGSGKTTVTLAIISAMQRKGIIVQTYKSGPDYIDSMFHSKLTKRECFHTDAFFLDSYNMKNLFANTFINSDIAVIEGAMGFYDGIGKSSDASSYTVSEWLDVPVVLIINPSGMGCSVGAICRGFKEYRKDNKIRGVILNKIKSGMYEYYKDIIEKETDLKVFGYMPETDFHIKSRHLGLVTANEIHDFEEQTEYLGAVAEKCIDIEKIYQLTQTCSSIEYEPVKEENNEKFRLGVAMDSAFCFYYPENLKMFEYYGAEVVYFSPLSDNKIPDNLDGIYFGGGYPELYLDKLSENVEFTDSLKRISCSGIPVFAECGGFMYLQHYISDKNGKEYLMAGLINGKSEMKDRLCRFGYITLKANKDNFFGKKGTVIKAHEFHYSDSTENGDTFTAEKNDGRKWNTIQQSENIIAGYPHLYFPSSPETVRNFSEKCRKYRRSKNNL